MTSSSTFTIVLQEFTNFVVGETYTLSSKLDLGDTNKSGRTRLQIIYNDGTSTSYVGSWVEGTGIKSSIGTITITSNIETINIEFQPNNVGIRLFDVQLEKGSTATSYVAHKEQNVSFPLGTKELCKIGNIADELIINMNTGIISKLKKIEKVVLNGSEPNWQINSNYTDNNVLALQIYSDVIKPATSNIISNILAYSSTTTANTIRMASIFILCGLNKSEFADIDDWTDYLSNNNLIIYAELSTPTTEVIGALNQADLETLKNLTSYEGETHVYCTNEVSPIFVVEAYQSTKLLLAELLAEREE